MTKLILALLLSVSPLVSANDFFLNIRNGVTYNDTDSFVMDGKNYDADFGHWWRLNVSIGYKPRWCASYGCKVGVSHESSPLSGKPFNNDYDYSIGQVFFEIEIQF